MIQYSSKGVFVMQRYIQKYTADDRTFAYDTH